MQTLATRGSGVDLAVNPAGAAIISWAVTGSGTFAASGTVLGGFAAPVKIGGPPLPGRPHQRRAERCGPGCAGLGHLDRQRGSHPLRGRDVDHAAVLSAFPDGPLDVAIDGAGDAIAVFGETHVSGVTSTFTLYDSKRPASGTWGPAAVLSVPGDAGYRPRAVADAAGTFIVAWSDLTAGTLNLLTSPPRGSFGPATIFTAGTLGDIKIAPGHAVVTFGTDVSTEPVSWGLSS